MVVTLERSSLSLVVMPVLVCLLAMLALVACDEGPAPPDISADDIVGFEVGSRQTGSLDALLAAYNQALPHTFNTETTPTPLATLRLQDGSRIQLQFSDIFPRDCVLVCVGLERPSDTDTFYEIKAPGLLAAVCELGGIDPAAFEHPR